MLVGLIVAYATLINLLGRGVSGVLRSVQGLQTRHHERREQRRIEAEENAAFAASQPVFDTPEMPAEPALAGQPLLQEPQAEAKTGLLARMPTLIKRPETMPEPELVLSLIHI